MPQVDYAALAEQARKSAPVDYSALAAQVRGEVAAPYGGKTLAERQAESRGAFNKALPDYANTPDPAVATGGGVSLFQRLSAKFSGAFGLDHPIDTLRGLAQTGADLAGGDPVARGQAVQSILGGVIVQPLKTIGHAVTDVIPTAVRSVAAAHGIGRLPQQSDLEKAASGAGEIVRDLPAIAGGVEAARSVLPKIQDIHPLDFAHDVLKPKDPVVTMMRATGTADPQAQTFYPKAMDELKQWEADTGKTVKDVPSARRAIDDRIQSYNQISDQYTKPQENIVVPGARAGEAAARIAAIPEEIRLKNPARYQSLVDKINEAAKEPEYTIGELNSLRQELGAKNKAYGKDLSGRIEANLSQKAMDAASERYVRAKFYDALQGGSDIQDLKSRIGAMIQLEDDLFPRVNRAAIQSGSSFPARVSEGIGHTMRPGKYLENTGSGITASIDSDIASALRRHQGRPSAIPPNPTWQLPAAPSNVESGITVTGETPPAVGMAQKRLQPGQYEQPGQVGQAALPLPRPDAEIVHGVIQLPGTPLTQKLLPPQSSIQVPGITMKQVLEHFRNSGATGDAGSGLAAEPRGVTQMVDARLQQFKGTMDAGAIESVGKVLGKAGPESPSANYGTEKTRSGGSGIFKQFPELETTGDAPGVIQDAIRRHEANPSASNVVYDRARKVVADAMQASRESRPESGPVSLFQRFSRARRQSSSEIPF
jgi:hypothetical protein